MASRYRLTLVLVLAFDEGKTMTNEYTASVLVGAQDIHVEKRSTQVLQPGMVRIRLGAAGICGTDLHYYRNFANAGFLLRNPVTLGHEAAGIVAEVGPDVASLSVGDKVAVNPVMACGTCPSCLRGQSNLCERKRYPGSATTIPHIDGYFRELFEAEARCCVKLPSDADLSLMAYAEPLACSLHGVELAGTVVGRKVLVTGSGPIGVLAAAAARAAGAARVVSTDINAEPLRVAEKMGVDRVVNSNCEALAEVVKEEGLFDIAIEASGAPPALQSCIESVRRGGTVIQLAILPSTGANVPGNLIMLKELTIKGSSQYVGEFERAIQLILSKKIDVSPMTTAQFPIEKAAEAFALALDRKASMKVQIVP